MEALVVGNKPNGPVLTPADSRSLSSANHSLLRSSQMIVDTALERAPAELFNARINECLETTQWVSGWHAGAHWKLQDLLHNPLGRETDLLDRIDAGP